MIEFSESLSFSSQKIRAIGQKVAIVGGGFSGAATAYNLLTLHHRANTNSGFIVQVQNSGIEWQDMPEVEIGEDFPAPPRIEVTMFHEGDFDSIGRGVPFKQDQPDWLCPNFSLDKFSFSDLRERDPRMPNRNEVGDFIHQQFLNSPNLNQLLSFRRESVREIQRVGDGWLINGEVFDAVVLCEGHSPNPVQFPDSERIVKNPYCSKELRKVLAEPLVFLRGFGDTGLDVLNSLFELDYQGQIGLISRKFMPGLSDAIRRGERLSDRPRNKGLNHYLDKITLIQGEVCAVSQDGEIRVASYNNNFRFNGALIDAAPFYRSNTAITENREPVPKLLKQLFRDGLICQNPEADDFARIDGSLFLKSSSRPTMSPAIFAIGPNIHTLRALSAEEFAHQSYEATWSLLMALYQRAWQLTLINDT